MHLEHSNTSLKNPVITTLRVNRDKLIATSHTCYTCTCIQKELSLILQSNNANSNLVILDFTLLRIQKHFPQIGSLFIYYWLSQTPATSIFLSFPLKVWSKGFNSIHVHMQNYTLFLSQNPYLHGFTEWVNLPVDDTALPNRKQI